MSAQTKIVVLHMKELIYTGIFAVLGILFIVLFIFIFAPGRNDNNSSPSHDTSDKNNSEPFEPTSNMNVYIPGIYTTELMLGGQAVDVEVIVDSEGITSVQFINLSESVATMYPLLQPTLDSISSQLCDGQPLDTVTYTAESKYTSLVLLEAIKQSLSKAQIAE
ncbi:MAG: hypothetical protein K6G30_03330 [Acetatifactor sp.]|nr:hypothetical protein [Acetatifactor sp.]